MSVLAGSVFIACAAGTASAAVTRLNTSYFHGDYLGASDGRVGNTSMSHIDLSDVSTGLIWNQYEWFTNFTDRETGDRMLDASVNSLAIGMSQMNETGAGGSFLVQHRDRFGVIQPGDGTEQVADAYHFDSFTRATVRFEADFQTLLMLNFLGGADGFATNLDPEDPTIPFEVLATMNVLGRSDEGEEVTLLTIEMPLVNDGYSLRQSGRGELVLDPGFYEVELEYRSVYKPEALEPDAQGRFTFGGTFGYTLTTVPSPGALALLGLGLAARRRR